MKKLNARSPFYLTVNSDSAPVIPPTPVSQVDCGDTWLTGIDVGDRVFELNTSEVGDIDIVIGGNDVPINFTLEWDGNTETTGFIGLDTYDSQLIAAGVDPSDINTGDPSTKDTTLTINKTSASPSLVQLHISAPLVNDNYSLEFNCPTAIPTIPCGAGSAYSGGVSYPTIQQVTLGSDTGVVTLDYNAIGIPDKFIVEFDGVEVINTGYVGNIYHQTDLNNALASYGDGPEPIVGGPVGSVTFNKTTATTTAIVKVYAPMAGTGWNFTLGCPE
jgi:hypothetical protein